MSAIVLASVFVTAGIALVRIGWGGRRRLAWVGWAMVAAATTALALLAGAWGVAVAGTVATAAAFVLLGHAMWTAPAGRNRPAREPTSVTLPRWRVAGVARRVAVFAAVVPLGFAATQLLAFGAEVAGRRAGWAAADTIVLTWMLQPVAWAALASVQMTRPGPAAMVLPALVCGLAGVLLWWPV